MPNEVLINLVQPLEFLIYSSIIMLIITTVFLVKLIADLSNLAKTSENFLCTIKHEIEPTMKELKKALLNINSVADSADNHVATLNKTIVKGLSLLTGSTSEVFSKTKTLTASLKQGLLEGIKVFLSKK